MQSLKLEGIAEPNEVVHRSGRKAEAKMNVELLVGPDFERAAGVYDMLRASALRKIAAIFDESV